ncbi:hypothetical protein [Parasitella parasitica]|uniref:Uncharacterized protein n=1 Tax=Parasitella parasitica TaxID=35722 RepID=A0A0B7NEP3_9FUNG|nr:hypothetical protein [Parasitella parasitica]
MSDTVFIAVHVGAEINNFHDIPLIRACDSAMSILKQGASSIQAVTEAIKQLEVGTASNFRQEMPIHLALQNDPVTNAGYGSNLCLTGKVECDASLMSGKNGTFGAVGAVSGLRNPIETSLQMVIEAESGLLSLGRIPPMQVY